MPAALPLPLALALSVALASPAAALEGRLAAMVREADIGQAEASIVVMDLDRPALLASINADAARIPASNMKLLTTAAAMDVLGSDHVYRTELSLVHAEGDRPPSLLIMGDGDPAFGDPVLLGRHEPALTVDDLVEHWVDAVQAAGHDRYDRLIVDDGIFDRQFVHPTWRDDQLINRWAAPVAGINFYLNTIEVRARPNPDGGAPLIDVFPEAPFLETRNQARTGDRDAFWVSRSRGGERFTFHGSVHRQRGTGPVEVTVHDPAEFFARVLRHELAEAGIDVETVVWRDELEADAIGSTRPLHVVRTTLPLVLMRTNQDSQNMFAEALLKRMGHAVTGEPGSWENGAAAIRMALRQRLGPSGAAASIADGSGLSRDNRVTARLVVDLLRAMHRDPQRGRIWRQTLAKAGESGTLSRRMDALPAEVYGKTGYIRGVSGLSGYLIIPDDEDHDERTIAFSFLFNGFAPPVRNAHLRDLQDELVAAVYEHVTR